MSRLSSARGLWLLAALILVIAGLPVGWHFACRYYVPRAERERIQAGWAELVRWGEKLDPPAERWSAPPDFVLLAREANEALLLEEFWDDESRSYRLGDAELPAPWLAAREALLDWHRKGGPRWCSQADESFAPELLELIAISLEMSDERRAAAHAALLLAQGLWAHGNDLEFQVGVALFNIVLGRADRLGLELGPELRACRPADRQFLHAYLRNALQSDSLARKHLEVGELPFGWSISGDAEATFELLHYRGLCAQLFLPYRTGVLDLEDFVSRYEGLIESERERSDARLYLMLLSGPQRHLERLRELQAEVDERLATR